MLSRAPAVWLQGSSFHKDCTPGSHRGTLLSWAQSYFILLPSILPTLQALNQQGMLPFPATGISQGLHAYGLPPVERAVACSSHKQGVFPHSLILSCWCCSSTYNIIIMLLLEHHCKQMTLFCKSGQKTRKICTWESDFVMLYLVT